MKVIICGFSGKMGKCLCEIINNSPEHEVVAGVDKLSCEGSDIQIFSSIKNVGIEADVIIDFSHPSAIEEILEYAKEKSIPAVICTTGFSDKQIDKIKKTSEKIAIFYSNIVLFIHPTSAYLRYATMFWISNRYKSLSSSKVYLELKEYGD